LPRTFQWVRRILSLSVALAAGAFGVLLLASPASAHDASATAALSCQSDGSVLVTWTIKNDYNLAAEISNLSGKPTSPTAASTKLAAYGSVTATQTVDASAGTASISFHATWSDGYQKDESGWVKVPAGDCAASPSPSPTEASPVPSPSQSTAAPVSSSPATGTGGGGSLPVTGNSLTAIVGVAVALLAGGVVLFVFARRRRTS
jgi:LPXTG-motif cell wall-anchored protein